MQQDGQEERIVMVYGDDPQPGQVFKKIYPGAASSLPKVNQVLTIRNAKTGIEGVCRVWSVNTTLHTYAVMIVDKEMCNG